VAAPSLERFDSRLLWGGLVDLETIFQYKLDVASSLGGENFAVVRSAGGVLAAEFLAKVEDRGVGEIDHVDAELQGLAFGEVEIQDLRVMK